MKGIKFAIGFAFILSAASLAGTWYLYRQLGSELAAREDLESQLVQIEERSTSQESQVNQYREEVKRLNTAVEESAAEVQELEEQLDEAERRNADLEEKVKALEEEKINLGTRVELAEVAEEAVGEEAAKLPSLPAAPLTPSPISAPTITPPPKSAPPATQGVVPAPKAATLAPKPAAPAVKPATAPPPKTEPAAVVDNRPKQVLSVNRKFNFAVVNVGQRDKLKVGDVLVIEQNGKVAGRIQVEKLYENFSACTILEETKPSAIQEGDLVRVA